MNNPPLKVGLFLPSIEVPAWTHTLINRINNAQYASIAIVAINKYVNNKTKTHSEHFSPEKKSSLLKYISPNNVSNLIERSKPSPDYREKKNISPVLSQIPIINITPQYNNSYFFLSKDDIFLLKDYNIDVLLNLSDCDLRIYEATSSDVFPYGIWYYKFTDIIKNYYGNPGARETLADWPETGSALLYTGKNISDDHIITRSYSCTDNTWIHKTNNTNYWKSLSFIPRALEKCYRIGYENFISELRKNTPLWFHTQQPSSRFQIWELSKLLLRKAVQKVHLRINDRIFFEQWSLLFNINPETSKQLNRYYHITPPKDRFWADPFAIYENDTYYVFFEELIFSENKGHICVMTIDKHGNYSKPELILKNDYHLSYPFIFKYQDTYFMIPESSANKTIDLYRCKHFPDQWEYEITLMKDVEAVDTTLFFKDNKWWLFTNIKENQGASSHEELFLFYSASLFNDKWIPHPNNPIVSDVKNARPAGKIFQMNEKIYRPSQNCSHRYGYSINFNEIIKIDEKEYQEHTTTSIKPDWDKTIIATHTYNTAHNLTVIDAMIRRKHWE